MANLKNGSSGEEVKKLQTALINAGYDVGSSGADGIFGANTQAAVKKYQQDNGLAVDGIAGVNTQSALYGSTQTNTSANASTAAPAAAPTVKPTYDPSTDADYLAALASLQSTQANRPTWDNSIDIALSDAYNSIVNRDKFEYDVNGDMLYQQYKRQYMDLGRTAMQDTMGQAAALTGGYGSTYGQSVGQQTYDAYLKQLNDVIPELYSQAYGQYQDEGDRLYQQYQMLGDSYDRQYSRYQSDMNAWADDMARAQTAVDTAYQQGAYANETEYERSEDQKSYILSLISAGYNPTDEELAAVGITRAQANALAPQVVSTGRSGDGGEINLDGSRDVDWDALWLEAYNSGSPETWLKQKANYKKYGLTSAPSYSEYKKWLDENTKTPKSGVVLGATAGIRGGINAVKTISGQVTSSAKTYYSQALDALGGSVTGLLSPEQYLNRYGSLDDYKEYTENAVRSIRKG